MSEGALFDMESLQRAMSTQEWQKYDQMLRDEWAARCFHFNKRQRRIKAASDRIAQAANHKLHGLRPTVKLDPWAYAWLNKYYAGWQTDPSFERDLVRHHPECAVKLEKTSNRVGWTPSARPEPSPQRGLILTDRRGNAA